VESLLLEVDISHECEQSEKWIGAGRCNRVCLATLADGIEFRVSRRANLAVFRSEGQRERVARPAAFVRCNSLFGGVPLSAPDTMFLLG